MSSDATINAVAAAIAEAMARHPALRELYSDRPTEQVAESFLDLGWVAAGGTEAES